MDISENRYTVRGTDGPDVIRGGPETRRIEGLGGRDTICGGPADNAILGGLGRDTMQGNGGRDVFLADATDIVTGGGGEDGVSYQREDAGVEVDLAKGVVASVLGVEGFSGIIAGIEKLEGTNFADELRGDRGANTLNGRDGDDFVDGRRGEDHLAGGDGTRDEVSFASAAARVKTYDAVQTDGLSAHVGSEKDALIDFEVVTGSDFDDSLGGHERYRDSLYGGEGDDSLKGLGGDDRLFGGDGNDIFVPGPDDDYVEGGGNRPVTGTKQPGDLVNYRRAKLEPERVEGEPGQFEEFMPDHLEVCFDTSLCGGRQYPYNASGEGHDVLKEIESVRGIEDKANYLQGDNGPNVLVGGKKGDPIQGWGGNDHLFGLGGEDSLWGDDGDDYLDPGGDLEMMDGGDGTDTCVDRHEDLSTSCEKGKHADPPD